MYHNVVLDRSFFRSGIEMRFKLLQRAGMSSQVVAEVSFRCIHVKLGGELGCRVVRVLSQHGLVLDMRCEQGHGDGRSVLVLFGREVRVLTGGTTWGRVEMFEQFPRAVVEGNALLGRVRDQGDGSASRRGVDDLEEGQGCVARG